MYRTILLAVALVGAACAGQPREGGGDELTGGVDGAPPPPPTEVDADA